MSTSQTDLREITQQFQIEGRISAIEPFGSGHIHETFAGVYETANGTKRYIHQRINQYVFKKPFEVMENIERVTSYARERILAAGGNPDRETLTVIPALDGKSFYMTTGGEYWRTFHFIEGTHTIEVNNDAHYAYNAARAFGNFQKMLDTLPGPRLHESIIDFHHTRKRFATFVEAVNADVHNRARNCKAEIDFILNREADASVVIDLMEQGALPERITHNDTKLNNVLFDNQTREAVCVIDLDTVMPGSALYDFGDMVRNATATAAEDDPDLSKVTIDLIMFEWLARGYLEATRDFLTPLELDYLAFGGKLITFEQAIRFLTDYLKGDVYYKVHSETHNLDRARNQIKMVDEMEKKMDELQAIVNRCK